MIFELFILSQLLLVYLYLPWLRLAAFDHKDINFINEDQNSDDKGEKDAGILKVDRSKTNSHIDILFVAHHASIVKSDKETDELSHMANVCTIVVVGFSERKIDQVVEEK